jgi:hypothetical protein
MQQASVVKANLLTDKLLNELGSNAALRNIEPYIKFEDSYKIEIQISLQDKSSLEANHLATMLTSKIASPWLVYYNSEQDIAEFIFNKDDSSTFTVQDFNVIRWAQWQVI